MKNDPRLWAGTYLANGTHPEVSLVICDSGGILKVPDGETVIDLELDALTIGADSAIDVTGKGYTGVSGADGNGPGGGGAGAALTDPVYHTAGSGGGYGGQGGLAYKQSASTAGEVYGSYLEPEDLGSAGGGAYGWGYGGAGGGAVRLKVGTLTLDGDIQADGLKGHNNGGGWTGGGGGAGGSVWIEADTLTGSANITANGGLGGNSHKSGGGGGGGRIAVYYGDMSGYGGTIQAIGGSDGVASASPGDGQPGAAGTVYMQEAISGNETLLIDNSGRSSTSFTEIPPSVGTFTYDSSLVALTVQNSGRVILTDNVNFKNIDIAPIGSAILVTDGYDISFSEDVVINSGGSIDASDGAGGDTTLTFGGDWINNVGTLGFTPGNGSTVVIGGAEGSESTIYNDNIFYNLESQVPGKTILFEANKTQTITNSLHIEGRYSSQITLNSSDGVNPWNIEHQKSDQSDKQTIYNVVVRNSNADPSVLAPLVGRGNSDLDSYSKAHNWAWESNEFYWVARGTDTSWDTINNWSDISGGPGGSHDRLPGINDYVIFDANSSVNCTLDVSSDISVGEILIDGYGRQIIFYEHALSVESDLTILSGVISHQPNGADHLYDIDIQAMNLTLDGGAITAYGRGYAQRGGDGYDSSTGSASHGGLGSRNGTVYGSITNPVDLGSGSNHMPGGGLIMLNITGHSEINGNIKADGLYTSGPYPNTGGAGGSVNIQTGTISGSGGAISADGGNYFQLGGGGGRVSIRLTSGDFSSFSGDIRAYGGDNTGTLRADGGAGTVYLETPTTRELLIENPGRNGYQYETYTTFPAGVNTLDLTKLTVRNGGVLIMREPLDIMGGSLEVLSGGTITNPPNPSDSDIEVYKVNISMDGDFTLASGGTINVSGRGFAPRHGPGYLEPYYNQAGYLVSGAGSHGGQGHPEGVTYGSITAPINLGSGSNWVSGGGAVILDVGGHSTIDGAITANGRSNNHSGAGGSIYIRSGTISGTGGVMIADGGTPFANSNWWGAGGGRIAIVLETGDFASLDATITAYGGNNNNWHWNDGAAGTIYLETSASKELIINNTDRHRGSNNTTQIPPSSGEEALLSEVEVIIQNGSRVLIYDDIAVGGIQLEANTIFDLNGKVLSVEGDWTNNGGTFVHNSGEVVFFGSGDSNIRGDSTFYDFTSREAGKTIRFQAGSTQTIDNDLVIEGGDSSPIELFSSSGGSPWFINHLGAFQEISNVDVEDSNANGSADTLIARWYSDLDDYSKNNNWATSTLYYWIGGAPLDETTWSVADNWSFYSGGTGGDGVPDIYDYAIYDSNSLYDCVLDVNAPIGGLISSGYGEVINTNAFDFSTRWEMTLSSGTMEVSGGFNVGTDLTVGSGVPLDPIATLESRQGVSSVLVVGRDITVRGRGVITHYNNGAAETYKLNITSKNLTVNTGGEITVYNRGYATARGPGSGTFWDPTLTRYVAGTHGGQGYINAKSSYGSVTEPVSLGSGGTHGPGGGAIKLVVSGTLTLDGTINANAGNVASHQAPGAGGSIWIETKRLTGTGAITADGGNTGGGYWAAGGGGGRVAVYHDGISGFDISNITAYGNYGGAAGTVYLKQTTGTDELIIDNGGRGSYLYTTQLTTGMLSLEGDNMPDDTGDGIPDRYVFDRITLQDSGVLSVEENVTLDISAAMATVGGDSSGYLIATPKSTITTPAPAWTISGYYFAPLANADYTETVTFNANPTDVTIAADGGMTSFFNYNAETYKLYFKTQDLTIDGAETLTNDVDGDGVYDEIDGDTYTDENGNNRWDSGGIITAYNNGYAAGRGPGSGFWNAGLVLYAAGTHGGQGYANSKSSYSSVTEPVNLGSGGAHGPGGGAIKLVVSGTLTLDGTINANAGNVPPHQSPGSGGSVWIETKTLTDRGDTGAITANGGSGSDYWATGGGGGRVAVYYDDISGFDISNITAHGGTASYRGTPANGAAGTVYLVDRDVTSDVESLYIDNHGIVSEFLTQLPTEGDLSRTHVFLQNAGKLTLIGDLTVGGVSINPSVPNPDTSLDLGGNTLTISGGDYVNNGGTLSADGSTVVFSGPGTQRIDSGGMGSGYVFNNIVVGGAGGTVLEVENNGLDVDGILGIYAGRVVDLKGQDLALRTLASDGTLQMIGTQAVSVIHMSTGGLIRYYGSTGNITLPALSIYPSVEFDSNWGSAPADAVFILPGSADVYGSVTITNGTLSANNNNINVRGDWTNRGNFIPGTGKVTLNGGNQAINGSTTFNDLEKVAGNNTLTFEAGTTQTILGAWTFNGTAGAPSTNHLYLRSSSATGVPLQDQWMIDPQSLPAQWDVQMVDVKDSNNIGLNVINPADSIDSGNNINWFVADEQEPEPQPKEIQDDPVILPPPKPIEIEEVEENVALGPDVVSLPKDEGGAAGLAKDKYGFDVERVDYEREPGVFYARWYVPGTYISKVFVTSGSVTLSEYSSKGPKTDTRLRQGEDFEKEQSVSKSAKEETSPTAEELKEKLEVRCTGKLAELGGTVLVRPADSKEWITAERGMELREGDILKTENDSFAIFKLASSGFKATVTAKENANLMMMGMAVPKQLAGSDIILDSPVGEVDVKTELLDPEKPHFKVKTAGFIIDTRESELSLYAFGKENVYKRIYIPGNYVTKVTCFEGSVYVRPYDEEGVKWDEGVIIGGGEEATSKGTIEEKS